jgi:DNA-3-methyladenine glycosylase
VLEVAYDLIGCALLVEGIGGRIVEVEAYGAGDEASHGWRGETARNRSMFGPPGHAYVYRSYGIHWMLNLVCEPAGSPAAVLVRAVEPNAGEAAMSARRPGVPRRDWCRGPGRLAMALGIGPELDGRALDAPPFRLERGAGRPVVAETIRIGITRSAELPWRFVELGSPFASATPRPPR